MNFFSFLFSKTFLKHAATSIVAFFIIVFLIIFALNQYTGHGKTIAVPDLTGIKKEKLDSVFANYELNWQIIDSVYLDKKTKGAVVDQTPPPGFHVKAGRTVYITVVAMLPQRVKMPNLVDLTLRQATQRLETYGLKVGAISYEPDIAKNVVLKQKCKGRIINADSMIVKGSSVDLVLGDGLSNSNIPVPYLINLTPEQARETLKSASLLNGAFQFDSDVKDSLNARVYKQRPVYSPNAVIKIGMPIDLWFTENEDKIQHDPSFISGPVNPEEMNEGNDEDSYE